MPEVFFNGRNLEGDPLAFSVENGLFVEVARVLQVGVGRDLGGATVMPGFIDAHCHVMPTGIDMQRLNLSRCSTPDEVLAAVRDWRKTHQPGEWLMAVHYDQSKFDGAIHMHRSQIDDVCNDIPVVLRHVNGHASVVNSAALIAAGVSRNTKDPMGGEYVRDASGDLTGVLLERAHEFVTGRAPSPSLEQRTEAVKQAAETMVQFGITCATDMMTGYSDFEQELLAYSTAAKSGCPIRLRLVAQWGALFNKGALDSKRREEIVKEMDPLRCKVIGAKIFADGAIGSATAAVTREFQTGGTGKLIYDTERLKKMVALAHDQGWMVAVHSIGDRATDHVLDAFESTDEPSKHRLEHAMILSDEQIERIAEAGCHVAMQPEFLTRFAHAYKKQLQPDVFPRLKRVNSCLKAGIEMSFNSDRPIVSGAPWVGIDIASKRPEGFDPSENIGVSRAIDLYTRGGSQANQEPRDTGEIKEGMLADFQIYDQKPVPSKNPLPDQVWVGGKQVLTRKT